MPSVRIYLVRHAESHANVEGRFSCRPPGPGLTPRGRSQAQAVCRRLLDLGHTPGRVLVSPMLRARETAAPLAAELGLVPEIDGDLRETGLGAWHGNLIRDLAPTAAFRRWREDPEAFPPPGGERPSEMARRVHRALARGVAASVGKPLAAFSHLDPIVSLLATVDGGPHPPAPDLPCGAIALLDWDGVRLDFVGVVLP